MNEQRQALARQIKDLLESTYGQRLRGVVLYGSFARGDESPDSDIDVLILLDTVAAYGREVRAGLDALYPLAMSLRRRISIKPVAMADYENQAYPLFRHARQEGIAA